MNRNGKAGITLLIGILLMCAFIVAMLEVYNVINIRALFGGEGHFIPINYEKEVMNMCSKVDSEGYYNKSTFDGISEEFNKLIEKEKDNKSDDNNEIMFKEAWKLLKGKYACSDNMCMYFEDSNVTNIYYYNCKTKESETINLKDRIKDSYAELLLDTACSAVDSKGYYEYNNGDVSCVKFYCTVHVNGEPYMRNCMKNNG